MLWHVFTLNGEGTPLSDDVIAAARRSRSPRPRANAANAAGLTWEAFVREVFARQRGTPATKADWASVLAVPAHKERVTTLTYFAYGWLTDAEVDAIDAVSGERGEAGKTRSSARRDERDKQKLDKAPTQSTRTIPAFTKGLLTDLMTVNGCQPPRNSAFVTRDTVCRSRPER